MQLQPLSGQQMLPCYPVVFCPSRLEWLCQPAQIEQTLRLLSYLTYWRKACQQLLCTDRQGLLEVQALVLEQAVNAGAVQAITYLNGAKHFPDELLLESAASNAARGILIHLQGVDDSEISPPLYPDGDRIYQQYIRPFYQHISGQDCARTASLSGLLGFEQIRDYIQERLQQLVVCAKTTGRPIHPHSLTKLCIAPIDLLHIRDDRLCLLDGYEAWEDLGFGELRKLDPEGFSEIALRYHSANAEYIFHLPVPYVRNFLPPELLGTLRSSPGQSRECAIIRGRSLDWLESLQYPAHTVLQDLGADIARICPHHLQEKEAYLTPSSIRDLLWPMCGLDNEEWECE